MEINFKNKNQESKVEENLKKFLEKVPRLRSTIETLNRNNVRYGLYAGAQVAVLTSNRESTDVDFLVADKDFDKLREIFPNSKVKGGKGNISDGIFLYLGGEENIEFMAYANLVVNGKRYPNRLTELVWRNIKRFHLGNISFLMLDPVDAVVMKAILQRGRDQGKHDLEDIEAIVKVIDLDRDYLKYKLLDVKADERVINVLRKFNLLK